MRFQGRITEWKDERGFGFITPNGGGARVFVHFSAIRKGEPRPGGNELVTYELAPADAKGPRAADVAYVERVRVAPRKSGHQPPSGTPYKTWISAASLIAIAVLFWREYSAGRGAPPRSTPAQETSVLPAATPSALIEQVAPDSTATEFKCEGKIHCSQMTSCQEATFYLRNCPGVKIDGDRDGIPCEDQWCTKH